MSSGLGPPGTLLKYFSSSGMASEAFTSPDHRDHDIGAHVILAVEGHGLSGGDLAYFAGPAHAAAPVRMGHVGGGGELLQQPALGVGIGAHPALFEYHVALLVELARDHVGQPAAFEPCPELQPVLGHRPEVHRFVEPRLRIQIVGAVALGHFSELVGDDVFVRFVLRFLKGLFAAP